jgi:hypothetical protein
VLFFLLLTLLPIMAAAGSSQGLMLLDAFYRAGSLVFGGGHVVLPLLETEVVQPGWVSRDDFLAGYGAAQAVPGPLFTFAAYLGTITQPGPSGILGATICLVAIFLPGLLLVVGTVPFWDDFRAVPIVRDEKSFPHHSDPPVSHVGERRAVRTRLLKLGKADDRACPADHDCRRMTSLRDFAAELNERDVLTDPPRNKPPSRRVS